MIKQPDITIDLKELNQSELVALCCWVGIPASRAWPRDILIQALEKLEAYDIPNPIDKYRYTMSTWLECWWSRLKMQAQKKACPNCYNCRDLQVLECFTKNKKGIDGR